MLEIKNVSKRYRTKNGATQALRDVSLTMGEGEIIGLFGENGAGKTTLMKSMLQLLFYSGEILLDGEKISGKNTERLSFATCEHSFFSNLNPLEHVEFYQAQFPKFNKKRFDSLMDFFELSKKQRLRNMSTGQKNQFEVIMALSQGADYILMDEPFAGNDVFNREDFYKVLLGILEPNETILLSTHLIEEVENFVGRAILLKRGQVVGDIFMGELEEQGMKLLEYVKKTYDYQADRVSKALAGSFDGEE